MNPANKNGTLTDAAKTALANVNNTSLVIP